MTLASGIAYAFFLTLSLAAVFYSYKLYQSYRLKWLFYYFISITLYYVSTFLSIIANFITFRILAIGNYEIAAFKIMGMLFSLLAFPFLFASWLFFIRVGPALIGKTISRKYEILYIVFHTVILVFYSFILNRYAAERNPATSRIADTILFLFQLISYLLLCLTCFYLIIKAKTIESRELAIAVRVFFTLYLGEFTILFFLSILIEVNRIICYIYPVWVFFLHIAPLLFLRRFLISFSKIQSFRPIDQTEMNWIYKEKRISIREQEIISLLLKGKSNQEIEDELFISLSTVKTHIYNIYKKLGIKSRWQLIHLVQNPNEQKSSGCLKR